MTAEFSQINRLTWLRFVRGIKNFVASEAGRKAVILFVGLVLFLLAINGLNVLNSYVGRDFMTAIAERNQQGFVWLAVVYIGVLAASTLVAVYYRFTEERLGLLWRDWLTRRFVNVYLEHPTYYRLNDRLIANGEIANPDQRIADDVRAFTVTTLSFTLMFLNGAFTVVAFSGVMWSISPVLLGVAVIYAVVGSYLTIRLGYSLVGLNYNQLDKEANFRVDLIHVRENAESIALLRREGRAKARVLRHLDELMANFRKIITVHRNLGFFTTGYNYLIQIIPALIVAPLYIRGDVEFGAITQAAMAFAHLLGAFSLIVTNFQSISSFAAVIARLGTLAEAIEQAQATPVPSSEVCPHHRRTSECPLCLETPVVPAAIEVCENDGLLAYERLTLRSPEDGHIVVKDLSVSVQAGTRLLVSGENDIARVALFKATAGLWEMGDGRIIRPELDQIMFLPERPYLPPGTLRELLVRTGQELVIDESRIRAVLGAFDLEPVLARAGGLDMEHDWGSIMSLAEQQLIAVSRLVIAAPKFVFLDRIDTALSIEQVHKVLDVLNANGIAYINLGGIQDGLQYYDAVLEFAADGEWTWKALGPERNTYTEKAAV
ncbi:ABC transporter, permease family protein [Methylocaldum marinum]|uniref:ABC transporter, permease family protein n=1 Tax=Methylocaldum marinum TaxID=1432792 RepID=A0A250KNE8_9GAMM|nr:SbmA/BacA-like family transporter [Methylocaldum marinum]BBA33108.1 ABC transporter, permease family protein [Methylocaldum marinum]